MRLPRPTFLTATALFLIAQSLAAGIAAEVLAASSWEPAERRVAPRREAPGIAGAAGAGGKAGGAGAGAWRAARVVQRAGAQVPRPGRRSCCPGRWGTNRRREVGRLRRRCRVACDDGGCPRRALRGAACHPARLERSGAGHQLTMARQPSVADANLLPGRAAPLHRPAGVLRPGLRRAGGHAAEPGHGGHLASLATCGARWTITGAAPDCTQAARSP